MTMALPNVSSIYREQGRDFQVVYSSESLIRLEDCSSRKNLKLTPEKFSSLMRRHEIVLNSEAAMSTGVSAFLTMTPGQKDRTQRRLHYASRFNQEPGGHMSRLEFDELVRKFALEIDDPGIPTYASVCRWVKIFRSSNLNPTSLMDRHCYLIKRESRVSPEVESIIKHVIEEVLLKPERVTESFLHKLIKGEIYEYNTKFSPAQPLSIPCLNTIRERVDRFDVMMRIERREGAYRARKRNKKGGHIQYEDYIGARVEMDSSLVDVFVKDEFVGGSVRPVLTLIIDVATRCILGWDLSLSHASASKTLSALRHAIVKDPFCETKAIPTKFYVDNGCEFTNEALKSAADMLGMTAVYCAPRSPDEKPHAERVFKTINLGLFHNLPGTTKSNPSQRADYDSEMNATLTIAELRLCLLKYITEIYHLQIHEGIGMSPLDKWRQLASEREPRTLAADEVQGIFCIPRQVTINNGRVQAFRLQWAGPGLQTLSENMFRSRIKQKVTLLIDPTRIGEAIVMDPTKKMPPQKVRCTLNPKFHDLSLAHFKMMSNSFKDRVKETSVVNDEFVSLAYLNLYRYYQKVVREKKSKRNLVAAARKKIDELSGFSVDHPTPSLSDMKPRGRPKKVTPGASSSSSALGDGRQQEPQNPDQFIPEQQAKPVDSHSSEFVVGEFAIDDNFNSGQSVAEEKIAETKEPYTFEFDPNSDEGLFATENLLRDLHGPK